MECAIGRSDWRYFPLDFFPVHLEQIAEGFLIMPGGIDCDQDYEEKEPVSNDANNNASPPVTHSSASPEE